ncbi:MAG: amidinotransferase [Cyclobacteriaceae bacterium]|nr:amidinotransferase [Cyclobacteriaceae bacterium]MCH8516458.1 amidinotransferase [Cyclobacteriaceae bacterium]
MRETIKIQTADHLMMVRPASFSYNEETAASNHFMQQDGKENKEQIKDQAIREFDAFVALLRQKGVEVVVIQDEDEPYTPDAVFPNNWVSFHPDGTMIYYPMEAESRSAERRADLMDILKKDHHFKINDLYDISYFEKDGKYLEGTGSIVFDYVNKKAYASLSSRTSPEVLEKASERIGFEAITFDAYDKEGREIYHTNVVMCMGDAFVVICMDAIPTVEHDRLKKVFMADGKEIVDISFDQLYQFAGNMLQVRSKEGESLLVMSKTAHDALNADQVTQLKKYAEFVVPDIATIEKYGGGSARCMMAALHLEKQG